MANESSARAAHSYIGVDEKTMNDQLRTAWYDDSVHDVSAEARDLLEKYSGYQHAEVLPCALELVSCRLLLLSLSRLLAKDAMSSTQLTSLPQRDIAFEKHHYACIGQMRFLLYNLKLLPFHGRVVERLKLGATFMDAGCCFGQELRYLIHQEQIPAAQLFGFDLEDTFTKLGFQLFRDEDSLGGHLVQGDVFVAPQTPEGQALAKFNGKIDVVFCSSFLHVWPWNEMVAVAKRLVMLTEGRDNAMICGKQLASQEAGHYAMPNSHGQNYRHNEQSMVKFWEQVGKETATQWQVDCGFYAGDVELEKNRQHAWSEPNQGMIWFCATKT